jgi:hypothetical protein
MRDLYGSNTGGVERTGDRPDLLEGVLVPDGVHAVPKGDVLEIDREPDHQVAALSE